MLNGTQKLFIAIETMLVYQASLATKVRKINKKIFETKCDKCRHPLQVKRAQLIENQDKVNARMHELVRKLNDKSRKAARWN